MITSVIFMTAGTMLLMWLGEQITQRGIGNGVSLLITVGILADIPGAALQTYQLFFRPVGTGPNLGLPQAVIMVALFSWSYDGHHHGRAGPAENPGPIREARRRQQGDGRPEFVPPAEGELLGRHARDLRERDPAVPAADLLVGRRALRDSSSCAEFSNEPPARQLLDVLLRSTRS